MALGIDTLNSEHQIPARGRQSQSKILIGRILGNYLYINPKEWGVEPGFVGVFMDKDFFDAIKKHYPEQNHLTNHDLKQWLIENKDSAKEMATYFMEHQVLKKYLVKQDYRDQTMTRKAIAPATSDYQRTSAVKRHRKKYSTTTSIMKAWGMSTGKGLISSKRKENSNAVLECLANDIAKAYGMQCQDQSLIFGTYDNDSLKIMTRCLWDNDIESLGEIRGNEENDSLAKLDQVDYEPQLKGKKFKSGRYFVKPGPDNLMIANNDISDLGEQLALVLAHGDRDVLGSKGANKHKKNGKFFWLDVGHAFRGPNPLVKSLNDDFSFTQPDDVFKNISAFLDNSLADKIKGMHYLNKLVTGQNPPPDVIEYYKKHDPSFIDKLNTTTTFDNIFDQYIAKFEALKNTADHKTLAKEYNEIFVKLQKAKQNAEQSNKKILEIFGKRLQLSPVQLDILESFEKLTSKISLRSNDNRILLNYARVTKRVAWQMTLENDNCILKPEKDDEKLKGIIQRYLKSHNQTLDELGIVINEQDGLSIQLHKSKLPALHAIFNEKNILQYKEETTKDYSLHQEFISRTVQQKSPHLSEQSHNYTSPSKNKAFHQELQQAIAARNKPKSISLKNTKLLDKQELNNMQQAFAMLTTNNTCKTLTQKKAGEYEGTWDSLDHKTPTKMTIHKNGITLNRFDIHAFKKTVKLLIIQNKTFSLDTSQISPKRQLQLNTIIAKVKKEHLSPGSPTNALKS